MLYFRKEYFEPIRTGRKTTTLRYWSHRRVRPGSIHKVPGLGRVRIESVDIVSPEDLTDADAKADGFASLAEMFAALTEMYPPAERAGRELYRVVFALADPSG